MKEYGRLFADDANFHDRAQRFVARRVMEKLGYEVTEAEAVCVAATRLLVIVVPKPDALQSLAARDKLFAPSRPDEQVRRSDSQYDSRNSIRVRNGKLVDGTFNSSFVRLAGNSVFDNDSCRRH
jgi:hypothetical protein